jgi:Uma2 family endonuclease
VALGDGEHHRARRGDEEYHLSPAEHWKYTVFGAMSARVILTYDDYAALPDDGRWYELYEGELIMMPSPRPRHQVVIGNLYVLMAEHVRGRLEIVTERAIEGAPTLVVEVLSPSTDARDRGVKQAL